MTETTNATKLATKLRLDVVWLDLARQAVQANGAGLLL